MRTLIVDGNNLGYKCFIVMYESTGQLKTNMGVPTTVTFGVLRMLNAFASKMNVDRCIVCWDGGSKYRKKIFKYYKHHRTPADWVEKYYEEIDVAKTYFEKLGLTQGWVKGIEADDVIGYLTAKCREIKDKVIIMSDDKDFFQLSKYNVRIYRPTKMELVSKIEMEERFEYPPHLLPRVVAFSGEQKDNIPGAGDLDDDHIMTRIGIGPKTALKFITNPDGGYYTVKQAIKHFNKLNKFYDTVKANKKQIVKSYKLSRIRTKDALYDDWELEKLEEIYDKAMIPQKIRRGIVGKVGEYLEFRNINLHVTLKKLGVEIK